MSQNNRRNEVNTIHQASVEAYAVQRPLPYPEWIIQVKAARAMLEFFPDRFSDSQRFSFYSEGDAGSIIRTIQHIAIDASKCKELNSIEYLVTPILTKEGWQRVTYYNAGDVVFVTVPGKYEGQKLVTAIFSLTSKLGQLEGIRRAAEKSGQKNLPMGKIRKLRKNRKARGFFANKH
jgi:hypothetical protein